LIVVDELAGIRRAVTPEQIKQRIAEFYEKFEVQNDCPAREIERAAKTSVALDILVDRYKLGPITIKEQAMLIMKKPLVQ